MLQADVWSQRIERAALIRQLQHDRRIKQLIHQNLMRTQPNTPCMNTIRIRLNSSTYHVDNTIASINFDTTG